MLGNIQHIDDIILNNKYLSIIHGVILWETKALQRLYDFGKISPIYGHDSKKRIIVKKYETDMDKTIRFIYIFFHRKIVNANGLTSENLASEVIGDCDFGPVEQLKTDIDTNICAAVADLIYLYDRMENLYPKFISSFDHMNHNDLNAKRIIENVRTNPWNPQYIEQFKRLNIDNGQIICNFCDNLILFVRTLKTLVTPIVFIKRENVGSIVIGSLEEKEKFGPHMIIWILLSFIYVKFSNNKFLLKYFYQHLNNYGYAFDFTKWPDTFPLITRNISFNNVLNESSLGSIYYNLLDYCKHLHDYPVPVGYAKTRYQYKPGCHSPGFSDCMGNSIRNCLNLLLHINKYKFGPKGLDPPLKGGSGHYQNIHPNLKAFYSIYSDFNSVYEIKAHNKWVSVISNIPYIAYNRIINDDECVTVTPTLSDKGYINVPSNDKLNNKLDNWLRCQKYKIINDNEYGYEVQPSIRNLIIALDYLLGLNLFDALNEEFIRSDFVKIYFPQLCVKLGITGNVPFFDNIDMLDYTMETLEIKLTIDQIVCKFIINADHAEFVLIEAEEIKDYKIIQSWLTANNNLKLYEHYSSYYILLTYILCKYAISLVHIPSDYIYISLFGINLRNGSFIRDIPKILYNINYSSSTAEQKVAVKDFLLRLADIQSDPIEKLVQKLLAHEIFIKNTQSFSNINVTPFIEMINSVVNYNNKDLIIRGINLSKVLLIAGLLDKSSPTVKKVINHALQFTDVEVIEDNNSLSLLI
jgi:hypothetical protein